MAKAFRRLGSDRNSVAINKAIAEPVNAVPRPTVGDISAGSLVSVELGAVSPGQGKAPVGARKTGAILLGSGTAGNIDTFYWNINNGSLQVTVEGIDVATATLTFWVF